MASRQISPAANLLRHSQLFSLPTPIRNPVIDGSGTLARAESESATKHHPTHASIMSTHKGRQRGDWGLKRNLPIRKTARRANPIVQVMDVDNIDHYTDYEAGTPHAISLRKFQEMNVPIMKPEFSGTMMSYLVTEGNKSVFDVYEPHQARETTLPASNNISNLSIAKSLEIQEQKTVQKVERWKFKGPWLAGMDEKHFKDYLKKTVTPKRDEFKKFLWSWMQNQKTARIQSQQMAAGETYTAQASLTEEEYEAWLVKLRHEGQQLYALMWEFLDLPGRPPSEKDDQSVGPPQTHPSAGLSYLKTDNILQNHPVLGPMREHQPVMARVLQKASAATGRQNERGEAVGVAGFVSSIRGQRGLFSSSEKNSGEMYGDKKIHVVPRSAKINERGRVSIDYSIATKDSVAIWEMDYDVEEQVKASKEDEKIEGFTKRPASFSDIFSSIRSQTKTSSVRPERST